MKRQFFLSTLGFLLVYDSLAGPPVEVEESGTNNWSYAFSTATYLVRNDREYLNPTLLQIATGFTLKRVTTTRR